MKLEIVTRKIFRAQKGKIVHGTVRGRCKSSDAQDPEEPAGKPCITYTSREEGSSNRQRSKTLAANADRIQGGGGEASPTYNGHSGYEGGGTAVKWNKCTTPGIGLAPRGRIMKRGRLHAWPPASSMPSWLQCVGGYMYFGDRAFSTRDDGRPGCVFDFFSPADQGLG